MARYVFDKGARFNWNNMPLLYLYIFQFIAEKVGKFNQEISSKLILEIWHRHIYHVPRLYDSFFLEEMEYFGLIKKEQSQRYMFNGALITRVDERLSSNIKQSKDVADAPLLYVYIFSRMLESFGYKTQMLTSKQLINVWRFYIPNVPRIYDYQILTEMHNYGLIRRIDSQKYVFYGGKGPVKIRKLSNLRLW